MRALDWTRTPLGAPRTWPQSLRTAVSIMLESRFPMYIAWGPQFTQLYNDGYRPVLGSTKHPAAMGRSSTETFAESWHIIGPMFEGVRRGEAVGAEDWMLPLDRNGYLEECYFTFSYSPIRDESGDVGGVLVTVTETTGRVLGERRLRTLRELAARPALAQSEEEAWLSAARALSANDRDLPFALLYRIEGGAPTLVTSVGACPQAAWPVADVAASRIAAQVPEHGALVLPIARAASHEPYGVLVAGISPRRALDDDYRGFLTLVVDHIASAIGSVRTLAAEKQRVHALAELDRAKTTFFSNVSHEFRTPLTLMLGPIDDGLADTTSPLPPAQRERQEMIRRNGLRLQKLVNTLLDFARIEAGRARAAFVPTDLSALTIDLASGFQSAFAAAGLELVVDCPPLGAPVHVDPTMWEKIVLNLLSNAVKFTFEGRVRVALRSDGARVVLTVEDSGIGIAADEQPRIFDRFHRVEGARGRSHEGTGIGLALVRELAALHGGTVTVESTPGRGSAFTVALPHTAPQRAQEDTARTLAATGIGASSFLAEAAQWNEMDRRAPAPAVVPRESGLIYVADDNADMRGYLERILSARWTVETFVDGAQALAAARVRRPDLMLADVMMPVMTGLELVAALRADPRLTGLPVLLLSARAGEEATIEGLQSGADEYLVKPFSATELLARVRAQLEIGRQRREAIRAREETLAVVSHDLRTPLSTIRSAVAVLERVAGQPDGGERQPHLLATIRRSSDRMQRLIDDLLDASSIDAGALALDRGLHAPEDVLGDVRETFEAAFADKGVALETVATTGARVASFDRGRISQALGNLVSNALKVTPTGGRVEVRASETPEGDLQLEVSDTGPGVPAAMLPRLFDRRWHAARTDREGHGLGLSIVKGIVDGHGGRVGVKAVPGAGSTFWLTIPALLPSGRRAAPALPPPAVSSVDPFETFLRGGGEMGALTRAFDWSKTSLGAVEDWPQSLRTSVSTMLRSPYPITMFWGPELVMLYNDPFLPIHGAKHPSVLGMSAPIGLAEAWGQLGPLVDGVMKSGESLFIQDAAVVFERGAGGVKEEAYFTWCYIPTADEVGGIAGLFAISSETTRQVVGGRRLAILRELSLRTALDKDLPSVFRSVAEVLAQGAADLPFAVLYAVSGDRAEVVSLAGLAPGAPGARSPITVDASPWELERVARAREEVLVEGLDARLGPLPGGPWPDPATRALALPVPMGGEGDAMGVLVAGLSPLRPLDEEYRSFLQLLARQISASVTSARAYDEERQRAEQLAELDRAKTAFFSNVSHEFRTPLTLILGPIENALATTQRSLAGHELEVVRRNALRLYKMVNTLLDFSRMEAGRAQATFVPTDLAAFTAGLASAFETTAARAGVELVVDCAPLPEAIYVDPEMWEKIVLNLLSNAVKYTHRGSIRVTLRWADERAELRVQDTGVGIPADELPRVFERFYRVRATEGRSHEGTGIGLALVQELARLHGGTVGVESELGQGSTFTVRIPIGGPKGAIAQRTPRPRSSAGGAALFVEEAERWIVEPPTSADAPVAAAVDARILLVDDNADLRAYVSGLLEQHFTRVDTARDGHEALRRIDELRPDVVLSDVMMPGLDGFGLVRALRARPETRAIPIILLSARAGDESTVEGLASGADDYLIKPFSARELIARVSTQLEMSRVRGEVARHELEGRELRRAVKTRDEWLRLVGHELRTPIAALSLGVHALIRGLGAERDEAVRTRTQNAERLLRRVERQVEQLVVIAELITEAWSLERAATDLTAMVGAVVDEKRVEAERARCPLVAPAGPQTVARVDARWMRQAVGHLIDNAIKFGAGKPVEVEVERDRVRVIDHGPGLSQEALARAFERFGRGASTEHYGGLGLGLWVARQVVDAHGGKLTASETPGGGATLTIELSAEAVHQRQ